MFWFCLHREHVKIQKKHGFDVIQTKLFRRQTDLVSRLEFIGQLCLTGCYLEFIYVKFFISHSRSNPTDSSKSYIQQLNEGSF